MSPWLALVLVFCALGCYASHERSEAAGTRDAGGLDARGTEVPDAGVVRRDGGDAAAEPLPVEPELDLGDDARPSDYPEAAEWVDPDPSDYPPGEAAVVPTGEPVRIAFRGDLSGDVDLEWDGRRWGLLFVNPTDAFFAALQPRGAPDGARVQLDLTNNIWNALVWAGGRFLVAVTTEGGELTPNMTATVGFLDERGVRASAWNVFHPAARIAAARLVHGDRWVLAWLDLNTHDVVARELDTDARWLGEAVPLTTTGDSELVRLVGLKGRAVAFSEHHGAQDARVLRVPLASDARATYPIFGPTRYTQQSAATGFRDVAVVADADVVMARARVAAFNPWDPTATVTAFVPIEANAAGIPGLASDAGSGLVALCLPVQAMGMPGAFPTEIRVFLFGPHLELLGAPATVGELTTTEPDQTGCEIAFSPDGILVAWWTSRFSEVWVRPLVPAGR